MADTIRQRPLFKSDATALKVGILAGGGTLPVAVAQAVRQGGGEVHIVGLRGEADAAIEAFPHDWVYWGAIAALLRSFRKARVDKIVIAGHVRRPDPGNIRPDIGFLTNFRALLGLMRGGDDSVLSRVVRFFEVQGFVVAGAHEVAPGLVVGEGVLSARVPDERAVRDIELGTNVIDALGQFDVGQAVVVNAGVILAIEGAEGTDAMLHRAGTLREAGNGNRGGVLVKRPKPGQELRVDMPTIGPRTVANASAAGIAGIAARAGQVLLVEREQSVADADRLGIFVTGYGSQTGVDRRGNGNERPLRELVAAGRRKPSRRDLADIDKARRISQTLEPFEAGGCVVVARRYTLAVQGAESSEAMLARVNDLRQWGGKRSAHRVGVLAVGALASGRLGVPALRALIAQAAAARLSSIALPATLDLTPEARRTLAAFADQQRLALMMIAPSIAGTTRR